ncbi:hypothetical protein [Marinobacter gelidimuriae]|nr:hypothetical protein [Marinobacter gelidimuriae]
MKRLLLWLLILTVLAWAGYKGGVWWPAAKWDSSNRGVIDLLPPTRRAR